MRTLIQIFAFLVYIKAPTHILASDGKFVLQKYNAILRGYPKDMIGTLKVSAVFPSISATLLIREFGISTGQCCFVLHHCLFGDSLSLLNKSITIPPG